MARVFISIGLVAVSVLWMSEAFILTPSHILENSHPTLQSSYKVESLNFCNHCVCGVGRRPRIVNGDITSFNEYPWAVQIKHNKMQHCGGSLITSRHILTAAHCIKAEGFHSDLLSVHLADNATHRIKSLTVHEDYSNLTDDNDIAIIELVRPVPLDGVVKTVCLPNRSIFKYEGMTGVAIGWGRLGFNEPVSVHLRQVKLPIMSKTECLKSQWPLNYLHDGVFCAGYLEGGRDTCRGDSGGSLHVRNYHGAMEVVGIVSYGKDCAKKDYPGVYTKVTNYLDWIGKQLNKECLCSPPLSR